MKIFLAYGSPPPEAMEQNWKALGLHRRLTSYAYRKDAEQVVKVYVQEEKPGVP